MMTNKTSLRAEWERFSELNRLAHAPPAVEQLAKAAFFCGSAALIFLMCEIPEGSESAEDQMMDSVADEIRAFANETLQAAADQN